MIIYFIVIGGGIISGIIYGISITSNNLFFGESVVAISLVKVTDVDKKQIFDTIANIENYPKILPNNFISVKIINQTESVVGAKIIFAEETITEAGVITTLIAKHVILPHEIHKIQILNGDAKNSEIIVSFKDTELGTEIKTDAAIHLSGILSPFGSLAKPNLKSAIDTTIDKFVEYSRK